MCGPTCAGIRPRQHIGVWQQATREHGSKTGQLQRHPHQRSRRRRQAHFIYSPEAAAAAAAAASTDGRCSQPLKTPPTSKPKLGLIAKLTAFETVESLETQTQSCDPGELFQASPSEFLSDDSEACRCDCLAVILQIATLKVMPRDLFSSGITVESGAQNV